MKTTRMALTEIIGLVIILAVFTNGAVSRAQSNATDSNSTQERIPTFEATARLIDAVQYNGSLQDIRQMLDQGADVNAKNNEGWHVLQIAVKRNDIEIVRLLLEKGANVNGWLCNRHNQERKFCPLARPSPAP